MATSHTRVRGFWTYRESQTSQETFCAGIPNYRAEGRARLFQSASSFRELDSSSMRSLTGRANRFQHWHDMLRFKEGGVVSYDFGGWYEGREDQERLRINSFKEEFGGQVVKAFN